MSNKIRGLLVTVLMSVSVNTYAESVDYYMQMNEAKLCIDYMTLPSYNFNQGAREEAITRRGNCLVQEFQNGMPF